MKPKKELTKRRRGLQKKNPLVPHDSVAAADALFGLGNVLGSILRSLAAPIPVPLAPVWFCVPCRSTVTTFRVNQPQLYCPLCKRPLTVHGQSRDPRTGSIEVTAEPIIETPENRQVENWKETRSKLIEGPK